VVKNDIDTLPYGDEIDYVSNADPSYKFAGLERDDENTANLDYAVNRYYDSRLGRWLSPDWATTPTAIPYSDLTGPQTLNLYGYVRNNPASKYDWNGHCVLGFIGNDCSRSPAEKQQKDHAAQGTTQEAQNTVTVEQVKGQGANVFEMLQSASTDSRPSDLNRKRIQEPQRWRIRRLLAR
jgi:RHS repeat-associated protein